jgi:geranylgeranyl pyrophosphate synthase
LKVIPIFELIREDLERVERKMREVSPIEYEQLKATLDYLLGSGGKRLRPALVVLSSKFYPADTKKVVSLAAAVETLHTATLIHDDLIDNSFLRRGNPTLNTMWNRAATVLTGDYLFARAAAFAAETESVRVVSIFAQTLMTICNGELNQIFGSDEGKLTREYYYQRIYSKTASLFAASTEAGSLLSGASETEAQALRDYGHNLGMAFQIVDDVLDFAGSEGDLGKPIGSDLRQGIITLPTIHFLEAHPEDEVVTRVLSSRAEGDDEVHVFQLAVEVIKESGAIESSMTEAQRFVAKSRDALSALPHNEYRQAMLDLADFVVERRK